MLQPRPPIVVLLGHVDHGKTSLLDALRKTDIAASEVGGITQSIRAFSGEFQTSNFKFRITFVDTPGHAAFSQMRSRGGRVADLALLIVSAVDGVMPQTRECIAAIASQSLPYIVVATKSDLPGASSARLKSQLAEAEVFVEGFGGEVPFISVSAKTGANLTDLLELIHLLSQLHPPQADPDSPLRAVVLESRLDARKGHLAALVVTDGTLSSGQSIYLGADFIGKVRSLAVLGGGQSPDRAFPSTPVEIMGLSCSPPVGSVISSQPSTQTSHLQPQGPSSTHHPPSNSQRINVILKADTAGSLEAAAAVLPSAIQPVFSGSGDVSESDVLNARSTHSVILGFNVKVPASVAKLAQIDQVKIYICGIIYELLDLADTIIGPQITESVTGQAEILAEFEMNGTHVAGCRCIQGVLKKGDTIRVDGKQTVVKSLKFGKSDVASVKSGTEFGASFFPAVDFKVGSGIMAFQVHESP